MRVSLLLSFLLFVFLFPNSAWSDGDKDCVNCGNALSGKPDLGSLERLANRIDCSYFDASLCRIWSRLDNAEEFHHFIRACKSRKSPLDILRNLKCEGSLHANQYREQYLLHLLVSERGTFATIFMDLGRHFQREGKANEFERLLNLSDEHDRRFLDYLDLTHPTNGSREMSELRRDEVRRVRRYACLFGAKYHDESRQPSDCRKSENL